MNKPEDSDVMTIKQIAESLDYDYSHVLKVIKKIGLPVVMLKHGTGRKKLTALARRDVDILRDYLGEKRHGAYAQGTIQEYFGHFYIIQLEPEYDPRRFKVGHAIDVEERLRTHKTSAPFSRILANWPCKLTWEKTAIDCLTHDCERVHTEVFKCPKELDEIIKRGQAFFDLMPTPTSATDSID